MMKYFFSFLISLPIFLSSQNSQPLSKPKLVVGIVVDQMRNDFIYRYWNRYGNGGFKRLVNDGFYFKNTHFNYIPTYTGPGHCSIFTGATPRTHGIIGNDWYQKTGREVYCVYDTTCKSVGSSGTSGQMSPRNQLSSTIGDEMKMTSNGKAKVFAVALKDRSAVLPAGHAADGAFWLDDETGNFISSSWYMKDLPKWVKDFNEKKLPKKYLEQGWSTLAYPEGYVNSIADDNPYESVPNKKDKPTFPYSYKNYIEKNNFGIIKATPYGNSLTKDLALACIKSEELGKDAITDLISISFSSADIVAHAYGPRSVEVEDLYLRLDKDIEELLRILDLEVGKNNYVVFLTADHGGADVPKHLADNKIAAGYIKESTILKEAKNYLKNNFGDSSLVLNFSNEQIFLDDKKLAQMKLDKNDVEEKLCTFLVTLPGISEAYPSKVLKFGSFEKTDYRSLLQNGYNHRLSGNICVIYQPAWMDYAEKGTTHGAGYNYDTHVPLIFYGWGVSKGNSFNHISITQIAPTLCEMIQVNQPNSTTSQPLNEFFK